MANSSYWFTKVLDIYLSPEIEVASACKEQRLIDVAAPDKDLVVTVRSSEKRALVTCNLTFVHSHHTLERILWVELHGHVVTVIEPVAADDGVLLCRMLLSVHEPLV